MIFKSRLRPLAHTCRGWLAALLLPVMSSWVGPSEAGPVSPPLTDPHYSRHWNLAAATAQRERIPLAEVIEDPFVDLELTANGGELPIHYQRRIVEHDWVYVEAKSGSMKPGWTGFVWGEQGWLWGPHGLTRRWEFTTDWQPPPDGSSLNGWEPLFQPAVLGQYLLVPGHNGSVIALDRETGKIVRRIQPVAPGAGETFVTAPITSGGHDNAYYNIVKLDTANPWGKGSVLTNLRSGGWLVRIGPTLEVMLRAYDDVLDYTRHEKCPMGFSSADRRPWPPAVRAVSAQVDCGPQRPAINTAPAVAPDGSVVTVSRGAGAYGGKRSYVIELASDLRPRWSTPLAGVVSDGCGASIPDGAGLFGCRQGARRGVDPETNLLPAVEVADDSTSSPVITPGGEGLYGGQTKYNDERGHLVKLDTRGPGAGSYDYVFVT